MLESGKYRRAATESSRASERRTAVGFVFVLDASSDEAKDAAQRGGEGPRYFFFFDPIFSRLADTSFVLRHRRHHPLRGKLV